MPIAHYRVRKLTIGGGGAGEVIDCGVHTVEFPDNYPRGDHFFGPCVWAEEGAYYWRDGFITAVDHDDGSIELTGQFPARQQAGETVYGGSPMVADVLQVMGRWGLTQEQAVALMHENA